MNSKKVTAKDVAKYAGVSQTTVSRVFSTPKGRKVNSQIAEKVLEAASELGYQPDMIARSLASGRNNIIALVIGGTSGPYYNTIIRILIDKFQNIGKQILVFQLDERKDIKSIVDKVLAYKVDGIVILAATLNENVVNKYKDINTPILVLNKKMNNKSISYVSSNHVQGGELVGNFIIENEYKNIAYIGAEDSNLQEVEIKFGFEKSIVSTDSKIIKTILTNYTYHGGIEAGKKILEMEKKPELIFCTSDMIAIGVIDAIRFNSSLKIPEDICVIGYDNANYSEWQAYDLTTVEQPIDVITDEVVKGMQYLLDSGTETPIRKNIKLSLVKRKTTK